MTARKTVSWRLPVDLLVGIYTRAEAEGLPVTTWVERQLFFALQAPPAARRQA